MSEIDKLTLVTEVQKLSLRPKDVLVCKVKTPMTTDQIKRIEADLQMISWPYGIKCVVLTGDTMDFQIISQSEDT